jgi:DUF971 family protein
MNRTPIRIVLHQVSKVLEIEFAQDEVFHLPAEFMRVYSPSAEVRGHGPGQETLQVGKRDVAIDAIEPVGHYAIQPQFSDGHFSGIFSWDWLYQLGRDQDRLWAEYLARLESAGASRDPQPNLLATTQTGAQSGGCGGVSMASVEPGKRSAPDAVAPPPSATSAAAAPSATLAAPPPSATSTAAPPSATSAPAPFARAISRARSATPNSAE